MKRFGIIIAALLLMSALSLAFLVIPRVTADMTPGAERAVPVLWTISMLLTAFAVVQLYFFSSCKRLRMDSANGSGWLVVKACSLFLIAVVQLDGAGAYLGHGPNMRIASVAMFACAGICLIDSLFSIMVSYLKWKAQHG
jgi:hypothetical protein